MAASLSTTSTLKSLNPALVGLREYDPEIKDVASYVHSYKIDSDLAVSFVLQTEQWMRGLIASLASV